MTPHIALGIIAGAGLGMLAWTMVVAIVAAIRGHDDRPELSPEHRRNLDREVTPLPCYECGRHYGHLTGCSRGALIDSAGGLELEARPASWHQQHVLDWPEGVELPRYTGADARRELAERYPNLGPLEAVDEWGRRVGLEDVTQEYLARLRGETEEDR